MESSSTFKHISSPNRDIEKIPAPLRSHISSPKSPSHQMVVKFVAKVRGPGPAAAHTYPCKTLFPTIRLTLPRIDFPFAEKERLSVRSLAERSHVGITQISELLKDKEGIRKMWILNSNENLKFRKPETSEIDEVLMKWFRSARAKNIPVSGVLLQEKARELGESLGLETFKASHKWMDGKIPDTSQHIF
ncbi:hypothetical protein AVEN_44436-1 [Araneus ventricosus]|uniref:HTH CENPB-type domain-containing protein n=1 Tax=Araneus ventricosus TaxID=182803 RepID=A0A4Y2QGI0_ARAVE|nr:hypothetical protein AVEN_44436-1 [Araneus ventricosus]